MFGLLFGCIPPSARPLPFAGGGDVGLVEPLNRLLGGEGTIFGRLIGGTADLGG